ncbi:MULTISPECIES: LacI family DNA-binding transcriptional regulator [unclassified Streptomyces]|uniref:LacI family DNA-binding transcriptional regulator n=1 Tax=unclassified Streptomyces TaxID=2593676 RepID=UPI00278BE810|nr:MULTISPECIES: LacI family DNA-binding transcriptional regulator [unclassified Streptomyces]
MTNVAPKRRPTSADVARRAGVSRTTVSYVLNGRSEQGISETTRRRVLSAVEELGYAPNAAASTLRAGRSSVVLLPMWNLPSSPATDAYIDHLSRELEERDLSLLIHGDRTASGVEGARIWAALRPAAVLVDVARCPPDAAELLHRAEIVTLLTFSTDPRAAHAPGLPEDLAAVARCAAQYLVDRGHRRLASLVPGGELADLGALRLDAVREVADAAGVPVRRVDCELGTDSIAAAIASWSDPAVRPSAVYAYNDEFALALIQVLRDNGLRVPEDIAVIGSGDFPMGSVLRPRLTTAHVPADARAKAVATAVRRLLDGEGVDQDEVAAAVRPRLVVRESA